MSAGGPDPQILLIRKGESCVVFRDYTYSVLIVSASEKLNTALLKLLPINTYWPVETVCSVSAARRRLSECSFDIILVNAPLPDDFGTRLAIDIVSSTESGVLQLVSGDIYEEVCAKAEEHGVLTISKPVTERVLAQSLHMTCAMIERMKRMAERQKTVDERIEEIRLINHAKWHLIEHAGMTEPEAHKYIEKISMDQRLPKRKVAEIILADTDSETKTAG